MNFEGMNNNFQDQLSAVVSDFVYKHGREETLSIIRSVLGLPSGEHDVATGKEFIADIATVSKKNGISQEILRVLLQNELQMRE